MESIDEVGQGRRESLRHLRGQPHPKPRVADTPGHVVLGGRDQQAVAAIEQEERLVFTAPGIRSAHDGGARAIGEQCVTAQVFLLQVGLEVQAGELHGSDQHSR